jgi:[acyl-carrier-protein] S-malonyltransferase
MLESLERLPAGAALLDAASRIAGTDLGAAIRREGADRLNRNEVASLVTTAFNVAALRRLADAGVAMDACAGYSVGQWAALCAAGMVEEDRLLEIVWRRAQRMNAASGVEQGAMLAVIGLATDAVHDVCAELSTEAATVEISNVNCVGNLTVAGDRGAVGRARERFAAMSARQLVDVPVSGAWHCRMMTPAAERFADDLATVPFAPPRVPVIDNVSGDLLPAAMEPLRATLVRHLDRPVQWEAGIRCLIARGIERFVEVGFGNALTKFGFFIDRGRRHLTHDQLLASG